MIENKAIRLSKIAREYNVGISTIVDFLHKKGHSIDPNPNTKIAPELCDLVTQEYSSDFNEKKKSESFSLKNLREKKETLSLEDVENIPEPEEEEELLIKDSSSQVAAHVKIESQEEEKPDTDVKFKVIGKVDLDTVKGKKKKISKSPPEPASEEKKDAPVSKEKTDENVKETTEDELKTVGKTDPDKIGSPQVSAKEKIEATVKTEPDKTKSDPQVEKEVTTATPSLKHEKPVEEIIDIDDEEGFDDEAISYKIEEDLIPTKINKLQGPVVVGRIDLPVEKEYQRKPVASSQESLISDRKRKRRRIKKDTERVDLKEDKAIKPGLGKKDLQKKKKKKLHRPEVNEEDVQKQIKDTLAKLTGKGKSKGSKYRREKRDAVQQRQQEEFDRHEDEKNILRITEFVSVNELANMMNVPVNQIIQVCMTLGLMVSINQRLDAETLSIVADEFNYKVVFISAELSDEDMDEEDDPEDLLPRYPIVTVMGHVDHGKTKLLDYIRKTNVIDDEAGGITQHIGAYSVKLDTGKKITFLDTPGHEAFTAMRARGAQITDVAIIVIAADDGIMPQTVEAINHAQAANVPIVFALNKIDKPSANPEKIKEELANMNFLVEDWGGKYQSQEISAINGKNIDLLLEKVLLEAELLELKANPSRQAIGTVIESSLDKGRGYLTTLLVETGTLQMGDVILAGSYYGHVKAMFNERGNKITEAAPSAPVLVLGLNGAPQAGDRFKVMNSDKEAKEIANKREQLQREQVLRTKKHITLDEIGRRIAIGNFRELNVIVKGDVDGSVEALGDSLLKLSNEEIQVSIIHKAVGQISESDILLAAASNAIVIGFQVRPSLSARRLAEKEQIEIRLYSIIYDAIEEIKAAMEGMLSPEIKEEITATLEVIETFKVTKVGTISGCIVREGKVSRNSKIRVIRDGIVVYTGDLGSLKRFKDDVKEVTSGLECGLNIANFNDIKVGDILEAFREFEVKKKL